jgi:hypothetical protein
MFFNYLEHGDIAFVQNTKDKRGIGISVKMKIFLRTNEVCNQLSEKTPHQKWILFLLPLFMRQKG